jgi:hypothetical protein
MALPSTTAKAIRDVMIAQKFKPSQMAEDFDGYDPGKLHKQFFFRGPRLSATVDVGGESHQEWELDIQIAWAPMGQGDVDMRRWDLADAVATLHNAMATDSTVLSDEFEFQSSDPEWNEQTDVWEVLLQVRFLTYQAVTP